MKQLPVLKACPYVGASLWSLLVPSGIGGRAKFKVSVGCVLPCFVLSGSVLLACRARVSTLSGVMPGPEGLEQGFFPMWGCFRHGSGYGWDLIAWDCTSKIVPLFFFLKLAIVIYLWLCSVFIAMHELSQVAVSRSYSCGERGLFFLVVHELLIAVASLLAEREI